MRTRNRLDRLRQDLRFAVRILLGNPGFSAVTLIVLALGIGATATMFSVVNGVLLRPLAFREPDRLVMLEEKWLPRFPRFETSPLDFLSWKTECQSYQDIAAFANTFFNVSEGDRPERIVGARVSGNLPELLGVAPVLGRSFRPDEDKAGANQVVLLGYHFWQRRFSGDPNIIGRVVRMNGVGLTVIGVMPAGFRFPREAEIWMPMGFTAADLRERNNHFIWAVGRLKPNVTAAQAQAEMDLLMPRVQTVWRGQVVPIADHYFGEVRVALGVLFGAAGCVLLIGCVNVASLLLARGASRQREMAVRASLGATRGRILQLLLTETTLISSLGGVLGLLLALGGITLLRSWPLPGIPRLDEISLDPRALLFTMALSIGTGVLFGLAPALRLSRADLHDALKAGGGGRVAGTVARTRLRNGLVIAELALAVVLLVGAGLLLKSLSRLLDVPLGFNPQGVLDVTITLPRVNYPEAFQQFQFADRLLDRLKQAPGADIVGLSNAVPLSGVEDVGIYFDGRSGPLSGTTANHYQITPAYLRLMQIPLIRGRLLTDQDTATSPPVVLINETMARRYFPDVDPIGKRLDISGPTYMREIVGVVGDVKQESLRTATPPQVYEAFAQKPSRTFHVLLRGQSGQRGQPGLGEGAADNRNPLEFIETVRQDVRAIDSVQPISQARTLEQVVAQSLTRDRFSVVILGLFAGLALILAAVGIYGVMAYAVTQRTNEIGIRIALGARPATILQLVMGQSVLIVTTGLGLGLLAAFALTRVLGSLLYEVQPRDPLAFAAAAALLGGVALAAAFLPARRATHVDPVVSLRAE